MGQVVGKCPTDGMSWELLVKGKTDRRRGSGRR